MGKNLMTQPTPTLDPSLPRKHAEFDTLIDAMEYAAKGVRGINFYSARGDLVKVLTYTELRDRAVDIGKRLVGLGYNKGDRIALIADTSADFVSFFIGCQYASLLPVPLPLPTSFGGREGYVDQLAGQMKSCGATAVITPENMQVLVLEAADKSNLGFKGTPAEFFALDVVLGEVRLPDIDDLTYLQYSSGSTRFPHGVSVTHRSLMVNCHDMGKYGVQLNDTDRCLSWLPFYHDMGLVGTFLTSLTCQATVDYLPTEDFARRPMTWLRLLSDNKATVTYSPTFGYDICARRAGKSSMDDLDLSSWKVAGIGGDMIRVEVMKNFAEKFASVGFKPTTFMPSYGLAECTLAVSFMPVGVGIVVDKVDERVISGEKQAHVPHGARLNGMTNGQVTGYRDVVNCGVPLPSYDLEIRDESGTALADHNIGRVFVRGPSVMRDYYNDPEATKACLSKDGWLNTGDMGYMHAGSLYIVGRAKDLIIINGKNHWPQDLEWAVEQVEGIRSGDSAAISLPGSSNEEVPTLLVQCRLRNEDERRAFVEEIKIQVMKSTGIQCQIELVPPRTLPRTSSGKLSRVKARAQFISGALSSSAVH
jgi:fatty-acyl-CoA synthase